VWDLEAETEVVRIERDRRIYGMAWSDDGERLYTGEGNGSVYEWSFPDGGELQEWVLQDDNLFDIDVAGTRILAGGSGGVLHLVDMESDAPPRRFQQGRFVNRAAVIPGSPYVAGVSSEGLLKIWNGDTGALHVERFAHNANTYSVTVSPDARTLATVGQDAYVRFWDVETGDLLGSVGSLQPK
jgi:WD40 repeat protein